MPSFDYILVDGVGRARQRSISPKLNGQIFQAAAAGPILEHSNLVAGMSLPSLRASSWFDDGPLKAFLDALTAKRPHWLEPNGLCGLACGKGLERESYLNSFKIDAHKAARSAGFIGTLRYSLPPWVN